MQGFDALSSSLDVRGVRESHLHTMLQKIEMSFKESVRRNICSAKMGRHSGDSVKTEAIEMTPGPDYSIGTDSPRSSVCAADSDMSETSTSFAIELGRNESEKNHALKRYQDFEKWMWKDCFNSSVICAMKYGKKRGLQLLGTCDYCHDVYYFEDNHCPSCHKTYSENNLNFSVHVSLCEEKPKVDPQYIWHGSLSSPLRIRLLKVQLSLIEVMSSIYILGYFLNINFVMQTFLIALLLLLFFFFWVVEGGRVKIYAAYTVFVLAW